MKQRAGGTAHWEGGMGHAMDVKSGENTKVTVQIESCGVANDPPTQTCRHTVPTGTTAPTVQLVVVMLLEGTMHPCAQLTWSEF